MENKVINKKKRNISPLNIVLGIFLVFYTFVMLFILFWGLETSIKTHEGFRAEKVWPNADFAFENFGTVFNKFQVVVSTTTEIKVVFIEEMLVNTLLYAVGGALIQAFVPLFVAYLTAKFTYKFSKIIYWVVVVTMTLPLIGEAPSAIRILQSLNLYDTIYGNWVQKFSFTGMYYLVFYSTFESISNDYAEAAHIDGAGETTIFFKIIFPLVRNMFFTVALLKFIEFWNDYQTPLLYLPSYPTISYGIYSLVLDKTAEMSKVPNRIAACVLVLIPILMLFIVFKNRLMGNISMGGLKE